MNSIVTKDKANSLTMTHPEIATQWHPVKNGKIIPEMVVASSHKKVWWQLPHDVPMDHPVEHLRGKHFDFEWEATVSHRANGSGCPFLSGHAVWKGFNDLATVNPQLAEQWHPTKNGNLNPTDVTTGSGQKAWWLMSYDVPMDYPIEHLRGRHFDFEWQATIASRAKEGFGCPFLSGAKVWKGFNDLATVNPKLSAEWHPTKNIGLKDSKGRDISSPDKITSASNQKVWWFLPYDDPVTNKHFDFEWEATVHNRTGLDSGCPFLAISNAKAWIGFNDLATTHPELAKQWHPTKNGDLTPEMITIGSNKKVWWYLPYDVPTDYLIAHLKGKHFNFEWEATPCARKETGCPYLSGHAVWKGFNDLETVNPELAAEWHPTKNGKLKPDTVAAGSHKKIWWMFPYDVPMDYPIKHLRGMHFNFEWKTTIYDRVKSIGCPYLTGHAVWKGFNDFKTIHPEVAREWHPIKNGDLTPDMVSAYSTTKVWWLFPYDVPMDYPIEHLRGKHFDFEWETQVNTRSNGNSCPYLSNQAIWKGFNDLETVNPELAKEWHPTKNIGLKDSKGRDISYPDKVAPSSNQKVWWHLIYIDPKTGENFDFEWKSRISDRNKGVGCPFIVSSIGEDSIRKILKSLNVNFEEQYKFKDRFITSAKHPLKDDFAIFDIQGNVIGTIEFHGIQHYEPIDFAGKGKEWAEGEFKKNQLRDKIKTEYLKERSIRQLIIPYWEFNNVEEIVKNFIKELSVNCYLLKTKFNEEVK